VIDTCGYVPRLVRAAAELLADAVEHYTFISSISVYPTEGATTGPSEDTPLDTMPDESIEEVTGETYGPLKALCEQAVEAAMPGRVLNIRPGLIVGPHDRSDRFTYWPVRIARGGEVLAPGDPQAPVQFIDVRDLAAWTLAMVERRQTGNYNATGPAGSLTFGEFLAACQTALNLAAKLTWVDETFLLAQEVGPFVELPLWLPKNAQALMLTDISRAITAGLTLRPMAETIQDTLTWANTRPADYAWRGGLAVDREASLLAEWST
jgi:2'-hydroxyisoflavone reductase